MRIDDVGFAAQAFVGIAIYAIYGGIPVVLEWRKGDFAWVAT